MTCFSVERDNFSGLTKPKKQSKQEQSLVQHIQKELGDALVCNGERRKISHLFHTAEKGKADLNAQYEDSDLFKCFQAAAKEKLNTKDENLQSIHTVMSGYSNFLFEKSKNKPIQQRTKNLFLELLDAVPEGEKRKAAKTSLKTIITFGPKITDDIENKSRNEDRDIYWSACKQFVNCIFENVDKSLHDEKNLETIQDLILNCLSCAGKLLTYLSRTEQEKTCIWAKRLFVPIGYAMHELCGVGVSLAVKPYIVAAMAAGGAWTLSLLTTVAAGYVVISLCEFLIDTALEVADENAKARSQKNIDELKDLFKIEREKSETPENQQGFFICWVEKLFKKITQKIHATPNYFKTHFEEKKFKKNALLEENVPYNTNDIWYVQNAKNKEQAFNYFESIKKILPNHIQQVNQLLYLQHKVVNCKNSLSDEEIENMREELSGLYKSISHKIEEKLKLKLKNTNIQKYIEILLRKNSKLLVKNDRNVFEKSAHHSKLATFVCFDIIEDTFGMLITEAVKSSALTEIVKGAVSVLGSLLGALVPVGLGILTYFLTSALAQAWDEKGVQIPNEYASNSIFAYLDEESETFSERIQEERKNWKAEISRRDEAFNTDKSRKKAKRSHDDPRYIPGILGLFLV